jgi:1-acyl-sn-glycerol-3-phosphate acyltransferase
MNSSHENQVGDVERIALGIVAPDGRDGMRAHVEQFADAKIPFIFDPGQGLPLFSGAELLEMIDAATFLAVNDYEGRMLAERTGVRRRARPPRRSRFRDAGRRGSRIRAGDRTLAIRCRADAVLDPTGCGDAYRAGLLYGIAHGFGWRRQGGSHASCAQKIACRGAQNHPVSRAAIGERYHAASANTSGEASSRAPTPLHCASCYPRGSACMSYRASRRHSSVFPWIDLPRRREHIRRWSITMLRLLRVETRFHGVPPGGLPGNLLIVANHISWLDIFVIHALQPARFVAKAELRRWPVRGWLSTSVGTLYVGRGRRRHASAVNSEAASALSRGDVVAIFPEGTTTDGMTMLPFKGSLLQPIVDAGGHVQPIAIRYRDAFGVQMSLRRTQAIRRSSRRSERHGRAKPRRGIASRRRAWLAHGTGASWRARPKPLSEWFWLQRSAARHLIHAAIVEPDRRQRAAPQAAGVEHQHVRVELQLQ